MNPASWSALAAFFSALCSFLIWRTQRRNYLESMRPDFVLNGWDRKVRVVNNVTQDVIMFSHIQNIGRGLANYVTVTDAIRWWCRGDLEKKLWEVQVLSFATPGTGGIRLQPATMNTAASGENRIQTS